MTVNYVTLGPLRFGADTGPYTDPSGVLWTITGLDGWGKPASDLAVTKRPRAHGGLAGDAFLNPRSLALTLYLISDSAVNLTAAVDDLYAAVDLAGALLTVVEDGAPRSMTVRQSDTIIPNLLSPYDAELSVQVVALDPRKYGPSSTQSVFIPTSSGGMTYAMTYPVTYTGIVSNGTVVVYNPGNTTAPLQFTFTAGNSAALVGPAVTQVETGLTFALGGLSLNPLEFVTVDTGLQTVLANGQASRSAYITSRNWLQLQPGLNTFGFSATSFDITASFSLTAPQGAWL